jgi:chaperone BCS1
LKDVRDFIDCKDWYISMNVPWRRGYLITGPPGNGKSSLVTAIASEIGFEILVMNLGQVDEEDIVNLMSDVSENSIVLLEDIDCAFVEREGKKSISLSTLLNLLDGVNACEGRIVVMTSNHPERLDPALIRPGRIDVQVELPNATAHQIEQMYCRFYPGSNAAKVFAEEAVKLDPSMASIQGHFLRYKDCEKTALRNIKELAHAEVSNIEQGLQDREASCGHDVRGPT